MRNTKLILVILLMSGSIMLLFVGLFMFSLLKSQNANNPRFDVNQPGEIDRRIDDTSTAISPIPTSGIADESPGDPDFAKKIDEDQLREFPDIYIYNRVPFEHQFFRVEGTPRPEGNPDFSFIVILKGGDETRSKSAFTEWLRALGLTGSQITSLVVEYR